MRFCLLRFIKSKNKLPVLTPVSFSNAFCSFRLRHSRRCRYSPDDRLDRLIALDFEGRAHDVVTGFGARVVKLIGDEVMFVSTDPAAACRAGHALMEGFGHEDERVGVGVCRADRGDPKPGDESGAAGQPS